MPLILMTRQETAAYIVSRGKELLPAGRPTLEDLMAAADVIAGEIECPWLPGGELGTLSIAQILRRGGKMPAVTPGKRKPTPEKMIREKPRPW